MQTKFILALIFIAISTQAIFGQAILKGRIIDKKNGDRLIGAQVYIPELQKGSISDKNGNYMIKNLPTGIFSVQISYVGYASQTQKLKITEGSQSLSFELSPTIISLNPDVSITAIGYSSQHNNAIKVENVQLKTLEQQASIGVMNKLSMVPGIDIISKGPGIASPVIRGLSQTNVLVLNNGVRMENYQFSENHPFMIGDAGISKIEIIKGPASLLYGSDAIGGVINFIKERPAAVDHLQADINLGYLSNTQGYETNMGVKSSSSRFSWGIRGNYQLHNDYLQAENGAVPNSRFNNRGASLFMGSKQKYGSFFIYYDYLQNELGVANPSINNSGDYKLSQLFQNIDYHLISSRNKLFLGKFKLEINAAYQNNRRRLHGKDIYIVDMTLQAVNYDIKAHINNTEKSNLIIGIQGNYSQSVNAEAPKTIIPNYFINDFSIYGLSQYRIAKVINLQAGARFDFRNILIPQYTDPITTITSKVNQDYNNLSFTLGGTFSINKYLLLRANMASAFRTPNVAELSQDGMHGNRYERGDINLQVQKSMEGDLGMHYHRNNWVLDISAYYNQLYNYIYLQYDTASIGLGYDRYLYTQTNAHIYGLEAGAEYAPWKHINLKAVYNYTIGQQSDDTYLPFIPQNKFGFEIKLHKRKVAFMQNTFISLGSTYSFAQNNPSQFETSSTDYFILNTGIGFEFVMGKTPVNIGVYGQNLTNTVYIDHLSTLKDLGYYNMGRNIALKVRIPLDYRIR
ncbi:MAG: TonB-dependent receptor [Bacteroidales bacterium]|nr:TonB-dependent receptor [Bacteroidales bacterium]